jgi:hypothetical protein
MRLVNTTLIILMLVGVIPTRAHSSHWGYWHRGGVGVLPLILVILMLTGRL